MQELLQSFTVLPSRYCNGASLADSASATSGNGLNQDEPKQEADMNQDLNCVEGNTGLGSNLVAFPWDKENVRPDWSAAAISTPSDPLTEGPRGGHSPGIPKSRRIVGGRDRTSERKVRTVALALPFQPSVQDRGMPASGRISPLSPDEYKAWTVGRGGNVDNERMALLSRCGVGSEEIRNHCLRASVRDEPLPSGIIDEEDDGAAEEEPANSQERDANGERAERNSELRRKKRQLRAMYLRSEVNRTQSRMDALALLEQNRKLRIEVLGLKAALHFERKTKKMISKPKDDTRRPHQSNNRIFVPINNNGVGHQIDTDFMPKMQLGATALANAGQLDESYLEDSFASVQDGDNVTPSAISCHGSFSNQLHQDKTREALSSGSNCHETGLSDRKISMVLGSLEGDLKRSTENVDKTLPSISQVLSSTSSEKAEEDVKSTKQPNPDKAVVCQQIQTNCLNFQIGDDHPMEAIESIPLRYEETATANNPGVLQKGDDKHEGTRIPADLNCTTLMEINENIQDNSSKNCSKTEAQFEKVYSYRGKLLATTNNCSKKSDVEQSPLRHQESNVKVTSGNVASISKNTPKSINSDSTDLEAKDGEESGILNHEKSDPTQLSTLTDTSFDLIVGSNEASRIKTESELYESPLCRPDPDGCHADSVLVDSEKDAKVRISTSNKPRSMQFIDQASPILQNLLPTQMKESSPESQNSTNTNDNIMLLEAIGEKAIRYRANITGEKQGEKRQSVVNGNKTLPSISQVLSSTTSEKAEEDVKSTKQPNPDKAVVCQQIQTNCLNFQIGDDHPMEAIESIPLRYEETATANNPGVLQKGDDKHEGTRIPADLNCTTLMEINENIQDNSSKNCSKTEAQFEKVYSYRGKLLATTNNCSKKSDVEQSPLRHQESNVKVTSGNVASISKNTPKSINSDSTDLEAKDGEESGILNHEKSDPTQLSTLTDTSFDLIVGSNEASRIKTESELYESPLCRPDPDGCHADSVLVDSEKDAKVRISTSNKPRSMQFIDQASPILQNLLPTQMKESSPESQNSTNTNDNIMLLEAIGEKAIRYRANVTEERQGEKRQSVVNGLIGTPKSMVTLSEEVNKDTAQSHSNCDTEQEPSYNYPQWGFPPLSLSPIPLSTEELSAETIELAHLNNLQSHPEFEHIKVPSESIMEKVNIPQNGASIELRMHEDKEESVTRGEHEDKYCGNNSIEGACHNNRNIIEIEADRKQSDDVDINSREEFSHMKSHKSSSERNECNLHDQDLSTEPLQAVTKNSERIPDSLAAKMTENPQIYFIDKDAANILTDGIRNKQCGHGKENKSDQRKHCIEAVFCDSNKRRDGAEERKLSNQISIELRGITCRRGSRIKRKFNVENTSDDSGIVFDETQLDMIKTDNDDQIATITRCSGEEPSTISRVVKSRRKGKSNPTSRNEFNINLSTQEGRNDLSTKISKRRASDNDVTSNNDEDRNFRGGIYMDSANSSQEKFSVSLMTNPSKKLDSSEFLTDDNTRSSIEGCHDSEATIINDTYNSTPPKEKGAVNKDKDNYFQEISNHHTVTKPSETECLHAAGVNTSNKGGIACGSNKVININKTSKNESAEFCCQVRNIEFQKVGQQETPVVSSGAPNTDHNQLEYPNRCKGNRIIELNNKGKGKRSASSIFLIEGDASDVEPNNCFMEQADYSTSLSVTDIFHKKIEAKKKNEMPDMLKCQARIAPISKINLGPDCHTIKPEVEENMHLYLSERKFPDKVTNYPGIPLPLSSPPMRITRSRRRRIQSDSTAYEEKTLAGGEELLSRNDVIERQGKRRGSNQKSCASFDTVPSPGNDSRKGGIH